MGDSPERHLPGAVRRRGAGDTPPEHHGSRQALVGEAGLADASRSVDDETVGAGIGQRGFEQVEVLVPTDQRPLQRRRGDRDRAAACSHGASR